MANLNLIKALAESKNIPITQLAQAVGVSEQQIHLMVRKNSTKIETLEKIARVLNVSVSVFLTKTPPRSVRLAVTMWKMARSSTRGRSITDR